MTIVAKAWLACALVVATAAFVACSSSSSPGPTEQVKTPGDDDSGVFTKPAGDAGNPLGDDDSGSVVSDDGGGPTTGDAGDAGNVIVNDAGGDAADSALPPSFDYFCLAAGDVVPLCGATAGVGVLCDTDAGSILRSACLVDGGDDPCAGTATSSCSVPRPGGGTNVGSVTHSCAHDSDCADFPDAGGAPCDTTATPHTCRVSS